jgi:glycosyltransferase involved in cell wall biosynthesis
MSDVLNSKKVLFVTSTFPSSDHDPVPAFIKDEAIWFKKIYPHLNISVLAPHSAYGKTRKYQECEYYDEYRFHYFFPFRWELLAGKGIQPALKKNPLLYLQLPFLVLAEFFATWHYVKKLKPDLIYAHWFTPQALTSALVSKITGVPFVFDTQASDAIVLKRVPFSKKLVGSVCKLAKAYTVPSQQTLDKLLYFAVDHNKADILRKVTMVSYGTGSVKISESAVKAAAQKYNLENKTVIYFIGRLVDRKGVDILVEAFSKLDNSDDTLRLVVVGDGQLRANFEKLVQNNGLQKSVIFTGFLTGEERFALLGLSSVCAIPSINVGDQAEGLPVVFMEAVTAGKVVVLSDATGAHEIVVDGKNAFVAQAGSVTSLTEKLRNALEISRTADKEFYQAIRVIAKKFEWQTIIKLRYKALNMDKL